jgi:DNA-binding transcriptional ArsR family regulator
MSLDRFPPKAAAGPLATHVGDSAIAGSVSARATEAAAFLKAISHEGRLMILCHLAAGERSVTALEGLLGARQAAVSQQLARLRLEGLVATRRDGKTIFYFIQNPKVLGLVRLMQDQFGVTDQGLRG